MTAATAEHAGYEYQEVAAGPRAGFWSKAPEGLDRDRRIPMRTRGRAALVYNALARTGFGQSLVKISHGQLAAYLFCSTDTVQRGLADLERCGWITVVRRPGTGDHSVRGWYSPQQAVPDHPLPEYRSGGLRMIPSAAPQAPGPAACGDGGQLELFELTGPGQPVDDRPWPSASQRRGVRWEADPSRAVPGLREVIEGEGPPAAPEPPPQTSEPSPPSMAPPPAAAAPAAAAPVPDPAPQPPAESGCDTGGDDITGVVTPHRVAEPWQPDPARGGNLRPITDAAGLAAVSAAVAGFDRDRAAGQQALEETLAGLPSYPGRCAAHSRTPVPPPCFGCRDACLAQRAARPDLTLVGLYPARCAAHQHDGTIPPCGPCKDARLAHEARAAAGPAAAPTITCPVHLVAHSATASCRSCRADQLATPPPGRPPTLIASLAVAPRTGPGTTTAGRGPLGSGPLADQPQQQDLFGWPNLARSGLAPGQVQALLAGMPPLDPGRGRRGVAAARAALSRPPDGP